MESELIPELYDQDSPIIPEKERENLTEHKVGKTLSCMRCGECCTIKVDLSRKDIERISRVTGMERDEFVIATYGGRNWIDSMRRVDDPVRKKNYCKFLEWQDEVTSKCSIYDIRPHLCKSHPTSSEYKNACPNGYKQDGIINTLRYLVRSFSNLF